MNKLLFSLVLMAYSHFIAAETIKTQYFDVTFPSNLSVSWDEDAVILVEDPNKTIYSAPHMNIQYGSLEQFKGDSEEVLKVVKELGAGALFDLGRPKEFRHKVTCGSGDNVKLEIKNYVCILRGKRVGVYVAYLAEDSDEASLKFLKSIVSQIDNGEL